MKFNRLGDQRGRGGVAPPCNGLASLYWLTIGLPRWPFPQICQIAGSGIRALEKLGYRIIWLKLSTGDGCAAATRIATMSPEACPPAFHSGPVHYPKDNTAEKSDSKISQRVRIEICASFVCHIYIMHENQCTAIIFCY